jgi:multidrug transporter EmrE-like cation transporter
MFLPLIIYGTLLEVLGDMLFRKLHYVPGAIAYILGSAFWAWSLRYAPLSKAVVLFSVLNVTLACMAGVVFYNESLTFPQVLGIICGIASVALLV